LVIVILPIPNQVMPPGFRKCVMQLSDFYVFDIKYAHFGMKFSVDANLNAVFCFEWIGK